MANEEHKSCIKETLVKCAERMWESGTLNTSIKIPNVDDLKSFLSEEGIKIDSCTFIQTGGDNWFVEIPVNENAKVLKDFESIQLLENKLGSAFSFRYDKPKRGGILIPITNQALINSFNRK